MLAAALQAGSEFLIAIFVAITAPLLLVYLNSRQHRKDREAEWAHQDKLAKRAADQAQALRDGQIAAAEQAATAATLLLESNERVATEAAKVSHAQSEKLDTIHTLVNSNLTASKQSDLDTKRGLLASLQEIVALRSGSSNPAVRAAAAIPLLEEAIGALSAELTERHAQAASAERLISELNN